MTESLPTRDARIIDDFSHATTSHWSLLSDEVMGGASSGHAALEHVHERRALRLQGTVSLDRRGGFLQMVRAFGATARATHDASAFRGVTLTVIGTPGTYFLHLRSVDTVAPWQYYAARLPVTNEWTDVTIAWNAFASQALRVNLDVTRLTRLGVVAAHSAFDADVAVARLWFTP